MVSLRAVPLPPEAEPLPEGWSALLDEQLDDWPLPLRIYNWYQRKGLVNARELVAMSPEDVLAERNLGREAVRLIRTTIEERFGTTWEDVRRELGYGPVPSEPQGWNALQSLVPDALGELPLSKLALPARLANHCRRAGIATLSQLVAISEQDLRRQPNVGKKSLKDAEQAIRALLEG